MNTLLWHDRVVGGVEEGSGLSGGDAAEPTPSPRTGPWAKPDGLLVLLLALGTRLGVVFGGPGGIRGDFGYDSGVYYAAGDALIHGRMPYADFLLVHPPAIALATAPFAAIGRLTTDHTGYALATVVFAAVGALNALLVHRVGRQMGCGRGAALAGGLFYAVWYGALNAEVSIRLEPLSSAAFLSALTLIAGRARLSARRAAVAGAALGIACCLKIWWVMPLAVVLGWLLVNPGRRREAAWLGGGAVVAALAIAGPFLVYAPRSMLRMVIGDQLRRAQAVSLRWRVGDLIGVRPAFPDLPGRAQVAAFALAGLVLIALVILAWRTAAARPVVVIASAALAVLVASPSYYPSYADFLAPSLAVTIAAAATSRPATRRQPLRVWSIRAVVGATLAGAGAFTAVTLLGRPSWLVAPFPGGELAARVAHVRCLTSDSATTLIQLNALSRAFADGCPMMVDFTGASLDLHPPGITDLPLLHNPVWQRAVRRYLLAGDATILVRAAHRLDPATVLEIHRHRVLAVAHGHRVYDLRTGAP